ncbi:MAG: tetratricopeptide repeat protein, partial [Candidatus Omnitrophica bacterium]|nr:tetratricopeptide repeat protein [Candidatus Omnitrophota bacterium]
MLSQESDFVNTYSQAVNNQTHKNSEQIFGRNWTSEGFTIQDLKAKKIPLTKKITNEEEAMPDRANRFDSARSKSAKEMTDEEVDEEIDQVSSQIRELKSEEISLYKDQIEELRAFLKIQHPDLLGSLKEAEQFADLGLLRAGPFKDLAGAIRDNLFYLDEQVLRNPLELTLTILHEIGKLKGKSHQVNIQLEAEFLVYLIKTKKLTSVYETALQIRYLKGADFRSYQEEEVYDLENINQQEIKDRIQQLKNFIAERSKETLKRSIRPTGLGELPMPIPISMLNRELSDRHKVIRILENMLRMMDGTDEKVIRDFERAVDNARDRITEQALAQFDILSDEEIYRLLTSGYFEELQREFQRIIENQIQHMIRFHTPSLEEQGLYVSEDIEQRYPRLPRYLKWLLTNNPQLENNPQVREWLNTIQRRLTQIPPFPEIVAEYSQKALIKSLYLSPELAMRLILYLARGISQDKTISEAQIRREIESELKENLPEDITIVPTTIEEKPTPELPEAQKLPVLPQSDLEEIQRKKDQLKTLEDEYKQFMTKFNQQQALVHKTESDLAELTESLQEAERLRDKVIIEALKPAVDGLKSKLQRIKNELKKLEEQKERYEQQIKQLKDEVGDQGITLFSFDPVSIVFISLAVILFGIPLYLAKKIIYRISKTPDVRIVSMFTTFATLLFGYYGIFRDLNCIISSSNFNDVLIFLSFWCPATIFLGAITALIGRKISKSESYNTLIIEGYRAFNKKRYNEAITLFQEAIKIKPNDHSTHCWLARSLEEAGKIDEAIKEYEEVIKLNPNDNVSLNNLGVLYAEKKQDDKAIEYYRRSLQLNPNEPIVNFNLGCALERRGLALEAIKAFRRALKIKPDYADAKTHLDNLIQKIGQPQESLKPPKLSYFKTLKEYLRVEKESWLIDKYGGIREEAWWSVLLGWLVGGILLWQFPYRQNWNLGTVERPTWIGVTVWLIEIFAAPFTGLFYLWLIEKIVDSIRAVYRLLKYPFDYRRLERVNINPSEELSDNELREVAHIYARMSKEYLERIFSTWIEAGQEEKITRIFKLARWDSNKIRIYADIGEYKQISKVAVMRFATTVSEQKVISDVIDSCKEKLIQKGVTNAVVLLKDILPYLTEHSRDRAEFIFWLNSIVDLSHSILSQGSKKVLAWYTALREYKNLRSELSAKFTTNPDEQKRLSSIWDALEGLVNWSDASSISLIRNTIIKIANFVQNPREFIFWMGTLSEINKEVLEIFCRDIETILAYYKSKKDRDWKNLPAVLNQYHRKYKQTAIISNNLLEILTDSNLDINSRIEKARFWILEQKVIKLGAPPNLLMIQDAISLGELLSAVGESNFASLLQPYFSVENTDDEGYPYTSQITSPIPGVLHKMGRDGMYSYWEAQKPNYYQEFLSDSQGLRPGFNRPGEKFRVAYDERVTTQLREDITRILPIDDPVEALKQIITYIRLEWPKLYDNFIEPKRELIKGKNLEEFIDSESVHTMANQLLKKMISWQINQEEKINFLLKIVEVLSSQSTQALRRQVISSLDETMRFRVIAQYWEEILRLIQEKKWLERDKKIQDAIINLLKKRIASINDKISEAPQGILGFYLSGGTYADFFAGNISCDCTKLGGQAFHNTIARVIDPGYFLFKIVENGHWVGNIYSVIMKDKDGKYYFFLDVLQINLNHPLVKEGDTWNKGRIFFVKSFFRQLKYWLAFEGFDYLVVSSSPSSSKLSSDIVNVAKEESGRTSPESMSLRKLGGTDYAQEMGINPEYVQGLDGNVSSDFQNVNGYKISLDKTTPLLIQQRQKDLEHLEKVLVEMQAEDSRLTRVLQEKRLGLDRLAEEGKKAAESGKTATAEALKVAYEKKKIETQKVEMEIIDLRQKIREKQTEIEALRKELGLSEGKQEALHGISPALLILPFTIFLSLFSPKIALAQGNTFLESAFDIFSPVLIAIGAVAGLFGFIYLINYILREVFKEQPILPQAISLPPKPLFEEFRLPEDLQILLEQALDKVSSDLKELIPRYLDVRIPFEIGITRDQGIKALRLLLSTLIEEDSVFDFLKKQPFYQRFKEKTKQLGLTDNFDQPQYQFFFTVPKEKIVQEEDRRIEEFIRDFIDSLEKEFKIVPLTRNQIFQKASEEKKRSKKRGFHQSFNQFELRTLYHLLKNYAYLNYEGHLSQIKNLLGENRYLEALGILEEFLRVGIGSDLIALEDIEFRGGLNKILERELEEILWHIRRYSYFQERKEEIIKETKDVQFEIVLSDRTTSDLLRGEASGDCTSLNGSSFYNTIPQFLFDPGFLNFKVIQDSKWVGNVYTIVTEREGRPVLIIDAIQLPTWKRSWPISVRELADKIIDKIIDYAKGVGFEEVLMSSFVSNFSILHRHFNEKYHAQPIEIEKVNGFEHLKDLDLWAEFSTRNEYLETFDPQWNYPLKKVNPNLSKQTLLLRRIWSSESQIIQPTITTKETSLESPDESITPGPKKSYLENLKEFLKPSILLPILMTLGLLFGVPGVSWAHYFVSPAVKVLNAIPEIWTYKNPAENTLWGIARDILEAQGQTPTNQQIVDKIHEIVSANPEITNPNLIYPGQEINIPHPTPEVIAKLTGVEIPPPQVPQIPPQPEVAPIPQPTPEHPEAPVGIFDWLWTQI